MDFNTKMQLLVALGIIVFAIIVGCIATRESDEIASKEKQIVLFCESRCPVNDYSCLKDCVDWEWRK